MSKHFLPISIVVAGFLISLAILLQFDLDMLQKIFSIIGSLSLGVALFTYLYKKKQDETSSAIEQIAFFREKIIPEWSRVQQVIKNKDPHFWFSRVNLNNPSIAYVRENYPRNFNNQLSVFLDTSKQDLSTWIDEAVLDQQIPLLNMLEEFSLSVNHFMTIESTALESVHSAFIQIVEQNGAALMFVRDVVVANPIYSATLSLYSSWECKVGKSNLIKNLEKQGFITKAQRKDIYERRRKNVGKKN